MNRQKNLAKKTAGQKKTDPGTFIATLRLITNSSQNMQLDKVFACYNKEYNVCIKHLIKKIEELYDDLWYSRCLKEYGERKKVLAKAEETLDAAFKRLSGTEQISETELSVAMKIIEATEIEIDRTESELEDLKAELNLCISNYGLSEYSLHAWIAKHKKEAMQGISNIDVVQTVASEAWKAAERKLYGNGKILHYRKKGQTNCLSAKKAGSGIIYKSDKQTVSFAGMKIAVKPVRKSDVWLHKALTHRIKYCKIKRELIGGKYVYFLQLVLAGNSPDKMKPGTGTGGLDKGVSTMSFVSSGHARFVELAPEIRKYELEINRWARASERRLRTANPDNYNPDGTVKKSTKAKPLKWKWTKGQRKAVLNLKSAYRLANEHKKQTHGRLANEVLRLCGRIVTEPSDYRSLAKRSKKEAERQREASVIKKKDGSEKIVRKFKHKKRFGSSINRHAPGLFVEILKQKCVKYRIDYIEVDQWKYRASQYDFISDKYVKPVLSERAKFVSGIPVQRDLYSAFLLSCYASAEKPDRMKCDFYFPAFLEAQRKEYERLRFAGDKTRNFGLKQFEKLHEAEKTAS